MLSRVPGTTLSDPLWHELTFDRVLQYYDGPRLLLRRTDDGQLYLAWWSDADESTERWLYLPLTQARLRDVLSGDMPSRNALNTPENGYVLVVDIASDTDTIISVVRTNASALPQNTLPLPGARLDISQEANDSLQAGLVEVISAIPPYEYHQRMATIAVPKAEMLRLHEGMVSAATIIKQQLTALEAISVTVVVGANGPSDDDLNDYIRAVSANAELGQLLRPSPDRYIGTIDVPVVQISTMIRGIRGASNALNSLFDLMATHQLLGESIGLSSGDVENWTQTRRIVESLDSFIQAQLDIPATTEHVPVEAGPVGFRRLFQEYEDLAPLSSISRLIGPVSEAGIASPDVVTSAPNIPFLGPPA